MLYDRFQHSGFYTETVGNKLVDTFRCDFADASKNFLRSVNGHSHIRLNMIREYNVFLKIRCSVFRLERAINEQLRLQKEENDSTITTAI